MRGVSIAVLALTSTVPLAALTDDADRICFRAVELHQEGELPAAIDAYKSCLAMRPNQPLLQSNFGAALAQSGRYEEAIEVYSAALRQGDDPRLRRNLGLAYYKSGAMEKAAAELEGLHAAAPDDLPLTFLLADCRLQAGQYQKVIDLLTPLEKTGGEPRAVSYLLGTALIRKGDLARGREVIQRITSEGDSAEARFVVATAAFISGDYPAAVQGLARAIELNPDIPSLQSYYGQSLLLTGDADGAAAAFRRELARNPNEFEANLKLGSILQFRKQIQEALPYLERALRLRPASLEARNAAAKLYAALGRWEDARDAYEKLTAAAPAFAEAHGELARIYEQLGQPNDAAQERRLAAATPRAAPDDAGLLPLGAAAPDFALGGTSLATLRQDRPVVLIFGSYTCPKFRFDARLLNSFSEKYGARAHFLLVYVQEAHTEADWQSTANQREGVSLRPARSMEEKTQHAALCTRKLPVRFPSVVDGMDRTVESAYNGWPSAIYVIRRDGRIAWRSRLGEQEFSASDFERAISRLLPDSGNK